MCLSLPLPPAEPVKPHIVTTTNVIYIIPQILNAKGVILCVCHAPQSIQSHHDESHSGGLTTLAALHQAGPQIICSLKPLPIFIPRAVMGHSIGLGSTTFTLTPFGCGAVSSGTRNRTVGPVRCLTYQAYDRPPRVMCLPLLDVQKLLVRFCILSS